MTENMTKYLIEKAETFATEAHKGQMRKGGKDIEYITHPIGVAKILPVSYTHLKLPTILLV